MPLQKFWINPLVAPLEKWLRVCLLRLVCFFYQAYCILVMHYCHITRHGWKRFLGIRMVLQPHTAFKQLKIHTWPAHLYMPHLFTHCLPIIICVVLTSTAFFLIFIFAICYISLWLHFFGLFVHIFSLSVTMCCIFMCFDWFCYSYLLY